MGEYVAINPSTMLNPTPVVLVSCGEKGNPANRDLVTLAWAGTVNSEPPMVSVSVRKERYSHGLIAESGEFVINLVNEKLTKACDWCGVRSGRDFDKFAEMGLTEYVLFFMVIQFCILAKKILKKFAQFEKKLKICVCKYRCELSVLRFA